MMGALPLRREGIRTYKSVVPRTPGFNPYGGSPYGGNPYSVPGLGAARVPSTYCLYAKGKHSSGTLVNDVADMSRGLMLSKLS